VPTVLFSSNSRSFQTFQQTINPCDPLQFFYLFCTPQDESIDILHRKLMYIKRPQRFLTQLNIPMLFVTAYRQLDLFYYIYYYCIFTLSLVVLVVAAAVAAPNLTKVSKIHHTNLQLFLEHF